jgi:hypothetical protein
LKHEHNCNGHIELRFFFSFQMLWLLLDRSGFFTRLFTNRNKTAVSCAIRRSTLSGIRSSQIPRFLNSRVSVTYILSRYRTVTTKITGMILRMTSLLLSEFRLKYEILILILILLQAADVLSGLYVFPYRLDTPFLSCRCLHAYCTSISRWRVSNSRSYLI